mmetsp:Transcript_121331/g.343357  ORF Transcript_121331/g.343357 Transcript_121331/m.343357 type:complete len:91 (+) Transcript_121331:1818-2090(+)
MTPSQPREYGLFFFDSESTWHQLVPVPLCLPHAFHNLTIHALRTFYKQASCLLASIVLVDELVHSAFTFLISFGPRIGPVRVGGGARRVY